MNLFEYAPNPTLWVDPLGLKYRSIGRSQNVLSGKDRTNKPDDYLGTHGMGKSLIPNTSHVHFEFLQPKGSSIHFNVVKNIHVPLDCCC